MTTVRTRFSPSPTGSLHLGGAHTALFNWLYARRHGGVFILRIEDTDKERSQEKFVAEIQESLTWLGLTWDEGPYRQSRRLHIYQEYVERLLAAGAAYYCDCDPEELKVRRETMLARGEKPRYDRRCRELGLGRGPTAAVRFKTPLSGATHWRDRIKGPIAFDHAELDDLVIMRADGIPTYNFAVVVDDITMAVTTVIRGDDHVPNTPRQLLIYEALGVEPPEFAHMPLMLGQDRAKLSKRHGALPVLEYRRQGFLPHTLNNYLARVGWSHGDQEIFSPEELIRYFSLENVGKSAGIFDMEKFLWLNSHYLKEMSPLEVGGNLAFYLAAAEGGRPDPGYFARVAATLQARCKTLAEMAQAAAFYFRDPRPYEAQAAAKFLIPANVALLREIMGRLEALPELTEAAVSGMLKDVADAAGVKVVNVAQPVRVALAGKTVSPGLGDVIAILGQEEVARRLQNAIRFIEENSSPDESARRT
ncbi:MAG: glutamate--tRNA ligase [Deltaproteobacteria bacterium]|nr:glutamate--tRNA ligase [Deltaproteobacteria bacterium]